MKKQLKILALSATLGSSISLGVAIPAAKAGGYGSDWSSSDAPYYDNDGVEGTGCKQGFPTLSLGMTRVIKCPDHHVITAAEDLCRKSIGGSYVMDDSKQRGALREHGGNVQWDPSSVKYHSAQYHNGEIYRAYCSVRFWITLPEWHEDHPVEHHSVVVKNMMSDHFDRAHLCLNWEGMGIKRSDQCRELTPEVYLKAAKPWGVGCDRKDPKFAKVLDSTGMSQAQALKVCPLRGVGWGVSYW